MFSFFDTFLYALIIFVMSTLLLLVDNLINDPKPDCVTHVGLVYGEVHAYAHMFSNRGSDRTYIVRPMLLLRAVLACALHVRKCLEPCH